MTPLIYPYKKNSISARDLAKSLNTTRIYNQPLYIEQENTLIINWGNSTYPQWYNSNQKWLNSPENVRKSSNKISTFAYLKQANIPTPNWTIDMLLACLWLRQGHTIFCRTRISSHGGKGIVIATPFNLSIVPAPLYTQKIENTREFRIHVFKDKVIDAREKVLKTREQGFTGEYNYDIKNHSNGWYFKKNIVVPLILIETALKAIKALDLDFGAVDLCIDSDNNPYVFEINTAPGITNSTLEAYKRAIEEYVY